jgi:hypothetical protein
MFSHYALNLSCAGHVNPAEIHKKAFELEFWKMFFHQRRPRVAIPAGDVPSRVRYHPPKALRPP